MHGSVNMAIIRHTGQQTLTWTFPHDPDSKAFYGLTYGAPAWTANTAVYADTTIVSPTVANGHYYVPTTGGKTGATEPTWTSDTVEDGTLVVWKAYPYTLNLYPGDTISASAWTADQVGVTLDNKSFDSLSTKCRVTAVPANATEFTLTNTVSITRANNDLEEIERSVRIKIKDL